MILQLDSKPIALHINDAGTELSPHTGAHSPSKQYSTLPSESVVPFTNLKAPLVHAVPVK